VNDPVDEFTATRLAEVIDDFAAGKLAADSWQLFFVRHYRGDVLEAARSEVVGIGIASGDELSAIAVARLRDIAARLRSLRASHAPDPPGAWRSFQCSDYFASGYARTGWWDDAGQCWYILPVERIHVGIAGSLLVIGGPAWMESAGAIAPATLGSGCIIRSKTNYVSSRRRCLHFTRATRVEKSSCD